MASTPDSSPSGQGGQQFFYGQSQANFNPTTAVVIISLIGGCFVLAFVALVLRKYLRGDTGLTLAQTNAAQSGTYNAKPKGLLKADVDALPLVHREDLQVENGVAHECPVCLAEFQADETLRLLPACNHVFHRDCIDAWFDAHSTCPLCRASLVGEHDGEAKPANSGVDEAVGHGEAVDTITEVSENGDSDLESRLSHSSDVPLDGPRVATREAGALLRNSESFNRATTSSDQQPSTKIASFRKPPVTTAASIRRSLSLSADLIALRNLLTRQGGDQNGEAPSRRWFSRARSLHLPPRDRTDGDEWVTIDLETGKAASKNADAPATSKGESSRGPAERAWSGRWSLAGLKGAVVFPLTRSTSDISSHSAHLPI